jgi:O-phosphoseryl-tRNA(Cys) synthetase
VPAYEGRAIQVERIEAVSGPAIESRNLTPFATTSASSHLPTDHGGQYQSWIAMDGSLGTAWVEGVVGPGVGEWIQLSFPGTVEIHYINLDVGYDRDADIFYANNRIKRVTFIFSNGEQIEMPLSDIRGMQMIVLARAPGPSIETTFVKIVIEEVYPGSRYDDTCLSEVEVWGATK